MFFLSVCLFLRVSVLLCQCSVQGFVVEFAQGPGGEGWGLGEMVMAVLDKTKLDTPISL